MRISHVQASSIKPCRTSIAVLQAQDRIFDWHQPILSAIDKQQLRRRLVQNARLQQGKLLLCAENVLLTSIEAVFLSQKGEYPGGFG